VIDADRIKPFFGLPVHSPESVRTSGLGGQTFDRLVVMSFETKKTRAALERLELTADRVFMI
jgi:hypothetical protein